MPAGIAVQTFKTPYGELLLGAFEGELCLCDWRYRRMRDSIDRRIQQGLSAHYRDQTDPVNDPVLETSRQQLNEYFRRQREVFDLPLRFVGTGFQQQVWQGLLQIPYGETRSYAELTETVADPKAIRAVSAANGANAISIIVPCHRVVGSKGELVGYAGGLQSKQNLLILEQGDLFSPRA